MELLEDDDHEVFSDTVEDTIVMALFINANHQVTFLPHTWETVFSSPLDSFADDTPDFGRQRCSEADDIPDFGRKGYFVGGGGLRSEEEGVIGVEERLMRAERRMLRAERRAIWAEERMRRIEQRMFRAERKLRSVGGVC